MTFIALDLEMEQPSSQIIQIGISYVEEASSLVVRKVFYITPDEPLSAFIQNLTGITNNDFDWNKSREECYREFTDELFCIFESVNKPFREFITWGSGDVAALKADIIKYKQTSCMSLNRFTDVKSLVLFDRLVSNKKVSHRVSLKSALADYKIAISGNAHDAGWDAYNTLMLFHALLTKYRNINKYLEAASTLI